MVGEISDKINVEEELLNILDYARVRKGCVSDTMNMLGDIIQKCIENPNYQKNFYQTNWEKYISEEEM